MPPINWAVLLVPVAVKLLLHLLVGDGYGFHRDEYYYLACGRHPDWGYVDQPPLVPLLGHGVETLFGLAGLTPFKLRWFSTLAGAGTVLLSGLMARELGGRRFAQGFAALLVLAMPLFLGTSELFQTVVFDELCWAGTLFLTLWTLRTGRGVGWLWVGLAAGIGLETKHTMGLLGLGLAAGLAGTAPGRRHLRTPWPYLGGAVALAVFLPNLLWQHAHGWPTAEFIHNNNAWNKREWSFGKFFLHQALFVGVAGVPLMMLGMWRAASRAGTAGDRLVAWVCGAVLALLVVLQGKSYYAGPIYPALAAVGCVALERLVLRWTARQPGTGRWLPTALAAGVVLGALPLAPLILPVLPRQRLADSWEYRINHDLGEQVGWPEEAAQVIGIFDSLPKEEQARTAILTVNYSEAAALEFYRRVPAAQMPVACGQNNYWLWGPGPREPQTVIVVGARHRDWMEKLYGRVERVATINNPLGLANDEAGSSIFVCREPKQTLRAAWPGLKSYD